MIDKCCARVCGGGGRLRFSPAREATDRRSMQPRPTRAIRLPPGGTSFVLDTLTLKTVDVPRAFYPLSYYTT